MKKTAVILLIFALAILIIPSAVVLPYAQKKPDNPDTQTVSRDSEKTETPSVTVSVLRSADERTERVDMEQYLIGVVGSEMPASFRSEALKAQAIAARTYIMARLTDNPNARVTDTAENQVYHNTAELKHIWGTDYSKKIEKIEKAVSETDNQVVTYKGKLISPVFFSTSNGRTENAGDYWTNDVPYLRSVASPWDKLSPKYHNQKKIRVSEAERLLGITLPTGEGAPGKVIRKTETGRVATYEIGGKRFTGRQIREKLKLSSTDFTLTRKGDTIVADTIGSGHGVGMSQYGAEGMAREGKKAKDIITYFYPGTQISKITIKSGNSTAKR